MMWVTWKVYEVTFPTTNEVGVTENAEVVAATFIVTVNPASMKLISDPVGPRVYTLNVAEGLKDMGLRILDRLSENAKLFISAEKQLVMLIAFVLLTVVKPAEQEDMLKEAAISWAACGTTVVGKRTRM